MSEIPVQQMDRKRAPIHPIVLKGSELPQQNIIQETSNIPENTLHGMDPIYELPGAPLSQALPTKAPIPKPVYSTTFTKDVSASLERCGFQVDYINPTPLGEGANHMVYSYQVPDEPLRVIKIAKEKSTTTLTHGGGEGEKVGNEIARSTFGSYAALTEIVTDPKNVAKYYVVQVAVKGKPVTNTRFKSDVSLQKQLAEIVKQNNKLFGDKKMCLDFVGMAGFTGWFKKQFGKLLLRKSEFEVSNIIEGDDGKLKIIDFEYFDLKDSVGIRSKMTNFIGMTVNRILMKHYFGLDIKKG